MNCTFEEYIKDVKSQLSCNDSNSEFITYDYTEEEIENNIDYFKNCWKSELSGYKALLFFSDHLNTY